MQLKRSVSFPTQLTPDTEGAPLKPLPKNEFETERESKRKREGNGHLNKLLV